jgi:hypothetical protein
VAWFGEFARLNFPREWTPERRAQVYAENAKQREEADKGKGKSKRAKGKRKNGKSSRERAKTSRAKSTAKGKKGKAKAGNHEGHSLPPRRNVTPAKDCHPRNASVGGRGGGTNTGQIVISVVSKEEEVLNHGGHGGHGDRTKNVELIGGFRWN